MTATDLSRSFSGAESLGCVKSRSIFEDYWSVNKNRPTEPNKNFSNYQHFPFHALRKLEKDKKRVPKSVSFNPRVLIHEFQV